MAMPDSVMIWFPDKTGAFVDNYAMLVSKTERYENRPEAMRDPKLGCLVPVAANGEKLIGEEQLFGLKVFHTMERGPGKAFDE